MSAPPPAEEAGVLLMVARQPIFDTAGERVGYELLYRADPGATAAVGTDAEHMAAEELAGALVGAKLRAANSAVAAAQHAGDLGAVQPGQA